MSSIEAIIEIAGGDSFAAAVAYAENSRPAVVLPTYVHTGTEYGDFSIVENHVDMLRDDLKPRFGTVVRPLEVISDYELWRALNGRFFAKIRDKFSFYSPCIGCHLYLHLMRLPIAARENARIIVAGERENHLSGVKINQTPAVLDAYMEIARSAGFKLEMPARKIKSEDELLAIAPWLWEEGKGQMDCVLSGNYRDAGGNPILPKPDQERAFIEQFLLPAGKTLARMVLNGNTDYASVVASVLEAD